MTNDEIVQALGFEDADEERKAHVVESVRGIVQLRVITVVTDQMEDDQLEKFNALVAAGDDAAVWEWLKSDVVGVDVSEVYEAILKDYITSRQEHAFSPK